jgi:hypothetical protein
VWLAESPVVLLVLSAEWPAVSKAPVSKAS